VSGALADPPAGAEAGAAASSSASDAPKSLPESSLFLSLQQSLKENPDFRVVRAHFDLGSPPHMRRYYCLINTQTGKSEALAVLGELVPRTGGVSGIKNIAVSQYSCADAQQQGILVTTGYSVGEPVNSAMTPPVPQPQRAAEIPTPPAAPMPPAAPTTGDGNVSREQIDIAGVKLGMSPDEVRAVLKSKQLLNYNESAETLSYLDSAKGGMQPIPNGRFVNVIAAWTAPAHAAAGDSFAVDGESFEVMFTPVPGKERAMGIIRSVGYSPADAIRETALEGELIRKFGGYGDGNDLPEAPTWRFQSDGHVQVGDSCNRRGTFGGLGGLNIAKTARENVALKGTPDDFRSQVERCGVALVTEDHYTVNGGALRADRLVTRFTVTAYSPSIAFDGAKSAVQLIQAAGGSGKKSNAPRSKDQPTPNL
jgi:hypothetical protein